LVQSFTPRMPLLKATIVFGLGRRRWSSQQCYLRCLRALKLHHKSTTNRSNGNSSITVDRMCSKLCPSSHDASTVLGVVNKLDRRRVLLTTRSTCGEFFYVESLGQSFRGRYPYFRRYPKLLLIQCRWNETYVAKTSSIGAVVSTQYWLVTDIHIDTRRQHVPR